MLNLIQFIIIQKNKEYIIFAPHYQDSNYCYTYDIDENKFKKLAKYPNNFSPSHPTHIIDPDNDEYYIFSGTTDIFGVLNLNTNKWKIHKI